MSVSVCLCASTLYYPQGGGHFWAYLNWALGLRSLGCEVFWLELVNSRARPARTEENIRILQSRLHRFGLDSGMALHSDSEFSGPDGVAYLTLEDTSRADLFLSFRYDVPSAVVSRFRRSALLDIDPGLLQIWMDGGHIQVAPHDVYFTIGETVGSREALFPSAGIDWHYTPPCVDLGSWPVSAAPPDASFTTVLNWWGSQWVSDEYCNDKRTGFLPFLELPRRVRPPLELALFGATQDPDEPRMLNEHGWRVSDGAIVAATPGDYQRYIQESYGEFSCAKPSCVKLQNAWISDRTLCYLASGKPAVLQHTGPSRFLPDQGGMFRFRTLDEAVSAVEAVAADYERQCRLARELAEEHFDARRVVARVLETALAPAGRS
jgi:hypothetical protein